MNDETCCDKVIEVDTKIKTLQWVLGLFLAMILVLGYRKMDGIELSVKELTKTVAGVHTAQQVLAQRVEGHMTSRVISMKGGG